MFGRLNKSSVVEPVAASGGALDRLGRRGDLRPEAPGDRETRLAAAAASLSSSVAPRLRELIDNGMPPGEVARQAGQQAQIHFRQNGVMLSPLELRGYVAEVLRPLLPAQNFSAPEAAAIAVETSPAEPFEVAVLPQSASPDLERRVPEPKLVAWEADR